MRILGSVESIVAVQGIHIDIVRESLVNIEPWPVIIWKRVAKKDGLRCVLKHVVCVLLPQAGLMRPVGSKLVSGVINN